MVSIGLCKLVALNKKKYSNEKGSYYHFQCFFDFNGEVVIAEENFIEDSFFVVGENYHVVRFTKKNERGYYDRYYSVGRFLF